MGKREGTENESDAKRIHAEYCDVFAHGPTTEIIISYLREDARFCFSLTSRENKKRVDDFRSKDVLYAEDMRNSLFRRARILYDAAREGHVYVIRYLARDEGVKINIICDSRFVDHPLFEPFTFRHKHYYQSTEISLRGDPLKERCFTHEGKLLLCEVSSRYGKNEVESDFNAKGSYLECNEQEIYASSIIGGHLDMYRNKKWVLLNCEALQKILQRASARDIGRVFRNSKSIYIEVPWETIIHRGDVELFDVVRQTQDKRYLEDPSESMFFAALMSGNSAMIERISSIQTRTIRKNDGSHRVVGEIHRKKRDGTRNRDLSDM